jgi:ABC-2 type transport system ATP-binding protein
MKAIEADNLTKYYGKQRGILDVSMEIGEGEIFGFIGPNGAGKSTTIRTLLGLIYPTEGEARIFGKLCGKETKDIGKLIGYCPSEVDYYSGMTVGSFLDYSARYYRGVNTNRRKELVERFEVESKRKFADLSMGNKKKAAIIQSLIHEPKLLILDEPTNGLDPLMQTRFYEVLREENKKGTTIFFSSHILTEVQKICERVAVVKEGRIIAQENIDTLRQKHLNRVSLEFAAEETDPLIRVDGVVSRENRSSGTDLLFSGDVNELIRVLSRKKLKRLQITEPSLEEVFMHYYEEKGGAA